MIIEGDRCRRGVDLFRPDELARRMGTGISKATIIDACHEWVRSGGREGLAHSEIGQGFMIRADAVVDWLNRKENQRAGILPARKNNRGK